MEVTEKGKETGELANYLLFYCHYALKQIAALLGKCEEPPQELVNIADTLEDGLERMMEAEWVQIKKEILH